MHAQLKKPLQDALLLCGMLTLHPHLLLAPLLLLFHATGEPGTAPAQLLLLTCCNTAAPAHAASSRGVCIRGGNWGYHLPTTRPPSGRRITGAAPALPSEAWRAAAPPGGVRCLVTPVTR